jgi:hypothetical protein
MPKEAWSIDYRNFLVISADRIVAFCRGQIVRRGPPGGEERGPGKEFRAVVMLCNCLGLRLKVRPM